MTNWYSSNKDIYTVGIEIEGKRFTYFILSVNHQKATRLTHDEHVAYFGPLVSITRCLVWGKCNDWLLRWAVSRRGVLHQHTVGDGHHDKLKSPAPQNHSH